MDIRNEADGLVTEKEFLTSGLRGITMYKDEEYISYLASIVESSGDAIISKSLDGTIKSWNQGGEKMFGYSSEEAIGKNISLIIPPEHIVTERRLIEKICNNETIDHYETVYTKKNGEQINVSLTFSGLKDKGGNIIGISKIVRDITLRKKFEADLLIANKELAFQNKEKEKRAAELVIANKELLFQNKEKEKRAAELIIANEELAFQNKEKEDRAAELIIANQELAFQNKEKEDRAAELIIANQELAFQNKEKEDRAAELEAVNKELEAFSYSVSHDLRAPLRAISGFTTILLDDYLEQLDQEAKEALEEIISNSNKMGELIDNLLGFSRISKLYVSVAKVNIKELVDSAMADQKHLEPNRIIDITIKKLENVRGDKNMLKQVFINLISNAFKYTSKKEEAIIEIGSYKKKGQCIYYVKDNGAGFDMKYADKLFGVFQRLHSSNEFDGTGVGLAIIQKIISKHGGMVWAEAKVNQGACFYVSLPVTAKNP